ncbi:MAG: hypothetical protein WAO15_16050 [Mycobacterium sp.]
MSPRLRCGGISVGSLRAAIGRAKAGKNRPPTGLVTYVCPDGDVQITVPFGKMTDSWAW